jgi:hypothetical protein
VFLYDVTSVYFEGQHNALAEFGYNPEGARRADQWRRVQEWNRTRNEQVKQQERCDPQSALRQAQARLVKYRLKAVRLVRLGEAGLGLWRLPGRHPAAQTEVLEALPKLPAPVLSLGKANVRRLRNPRRGRSNQ